MGFKNVSLTAVTLCHWLPAMIFQVFPVDYLLLVVGQGHLKQNVTE